MINAPARYYVPVTPQRTHQARGDELPPLAGPDASDHERSVAVVARMVARYGAPTLEHYRHVYNALGADWPGDDEIRRLHPVAAEPAT